jgi:hypothetical protein
MKGAVGVVTISLLVGCGPQETIKHGNNGNPDGGMPSTGTGGGGVPLPQPDLLPPDPNADYDHDGASIAQGDCNDWEPLVGPNSVEVTGNMTDDDCDGMVDETEMLCDSAVVGQNDAAALAKAIDSCDSRFLLDAKLVGPSDTRGRANVAKFGIVDKKSGTAMALLSTGLAVDKMGTGWVKPQQGTNLAQTNTSANPDPNVPAVMGCGSTQPATVNDYTELLMKLKVPQNANSFSFQFHFFSAEYPEFVCTTYNDEFLVEMQSTQYPSFTNISFDAAKNPITVNNGFFTICDNYTPKPQTQHCTKPVSDIAGTGYEDSDGSKPIGGSTGWLTTTAPVVPGETITLRFIIFDEGDHIYDSSVLIDNFQWSVKAVGGPQTIP